MYSYSFVPVSVLEMLNVVHLIHYFPEHWTLSVRLVWWPLKEVHLVLYTPYHKRLPLYFWVCSGILVNKMCSYICMFLKNFMAFLLLRETNEEGIIGVTHFHRRGYEGWLVKSIRYSSDLEFSSILFFGYNVCWKFPFVATYGPSTSDNLLSLYSQGLNMTLQRSSY
jgi:hypothetical protein